MHTFSLARFWESSISSLNLSDLSVLFLDQLSLLLLHFYLLFFLYKGQCSFQSSFFLLKQKRFTGNTMELAFDPILSVLLFLEAWVDLLEAWETVLILLQTTWCHQKCLETQSKQLDSFKFTLISWLTSSQKSPPNSLDQFFFLGLQITCLHALLICIPLFGLFGLLLFTVQPASRTTSSSLPPSGTTCSGLPELGSIVTDMTLNECYCGCPLTHKRRSFQKR